MAGTKEQRGLKPRMIEYLFKMIKEANKMNQITLSAYMVEIYLNKLEDVFWKVEEAKRLNLNKNDPIDITNAPEIKVRVGKRNKVVLQGVVEKEFTSVEQMITYCDDAEYRRRVRKTGLNEESSDHI